MMALQDEPEETAPSSSPQPLARASPDQRPASNPSTPTVVQQAEDLKELFFESGGIIHENAQFESLESPMLDVSGAPGYTFLKSFGTKIESGSSCADALPIREHETHAILEYAGRVLAAGPSRDRTRHEAIFVSFGPGTGKTSFMISAAEALDDFAFNQTHQRPLVITLTYNAQMSKSITKTCWPDASEGQAAALRMLFGTLKSMGCTGLRDWDSVLRVLAPSGEHAGLWTHIQDPAWAMEILAIWFGQRPAQILIVDELIKATCEETAYLYETEDVSDLAKSFYSLMDTHPGLIVIQSAMSTEQIDTTGSNRIAMNLLMKVFTKAQFDAADPCLFFGSRKLRPGDGDLVFALGGGHPRTMVRLGSDGASRDGRDAIFQIAGSEVAEGRRDDDVLELVLENGERRAIFDDFAKLMEYEFPCMGGNGKPLSLRNLVHAGTLNTVAVFGHPKCLTFDVPGARLLDLRFVPPQVRMPSRVRLLAKALDHEVLDAADTKAADVAERISIFASLLALSLIEPPNTGRENGDQDILPDILPCLNDVLQTEDQSIQSCWAGAGDEEPVESFLARLGLDKCAAALRAEGVNTVGTLRKLSADQLKQLAPKRLTVADQMAQIKLELRLDDGLELAAAVEAANKALELEAAGSMAEQVAKLLSQVVPGEVVLKLGEVIVLQEALASVPESVPQVQVVNDLAIPNETGTDDEKLSQLIEFLREPQQPPARADGRWSARIVASPRGCPSVDYVVHLQATSSTSGVRYDRYIAVQVKSAIGAATTTREVITERLIKKLDKAGRNLAERDFQFDAFVFHTADDVDIVPDKQAPWLEKAWVVSGKAFARHFPPSILTLMSLVAVDEK
jgi:hypothetical protein